MPGPAGRIVRLPAGKCHLPDLAGEQDLLARLGQQLAELGSGERRPVALTGISGVGKTQLTVEHAHTYRDALDVVWTVRAEDPVIAGQDYAALAVALQLPGSDDSDLSVVAGLTRAWLTTHDRWLLICDSATNAAGIDPLLPDEIRGQVLVTSRNPAWPPRYMRLAVDTLPADAGATLLLGRTRQTDQNDARLLAVELGGLPLALEQAAACCIQAGLTLTSYRQLYRNTSAELLDRASQSGQAAVTVTAQHVRDLNPAAAALLDLLAYLAPEAIPRTLLTDTLPADDNSGAPSDGDGEVGDSADQPLSSSLARPPINTAPDSATSTEDEELSEQLDAVLAPLGALEDDFALADAVGLLHRYGLLTATADTLTVHRLTQTALRATHSRLQHHAFALSAAIIVLDALPEVDHTTWPVYQQLLPHALAAADHAADLPDPGCNSPSLLFVAGAYLADRGMFVAAEPVAARALQLAESQAGSDDTYLILPQLLLGRVRRDLGHPETAQPLFERAVGIAEANYAADHPNLLFPLNSLGDVLRQRGDPAAAQPLFERAVAIAEASYGPDHPNLLFPLKGLGLALAAQGDLAAAQPLLERAVAIAEASYGPDDPNLLGPLNSLGDVLRQREDLAAAQPLFERAVGIAEANYAADDPNLLFLLNSLGDVLRQRGDPAAAQPLPYSDWLLGDSAAQMPNDDECELLNVLALGPETYPQVVGPVVYRYAQVMAGIMNLGEALTYVAADVSKQPLPFRYVEKLAKVSLDMQRNGRSGDATVLASILLRATEACGRASDNVLWGEAAYAYLQCLASDLHEKPDVPLYVKTAAVADRLVGAERAPASRAGDNDRLARALSCSGQLRLAIAIRDRAGPEYWEPDGSWRGSAIVFLGLTDPAPADYRLDNALAVVARAAEELQEAADLRSGDARAGSLIMVAQARHWLHLASKVSSDEVVRPLREALELLDPNGPKAALIAPAELLLAHYNVSAASSDTAEPFADLAARVGIKPAISALMARLERAFYDRDLAGARAAALRCWDEIPYDEMNDEDRYGLLNLSVHALDPGIVYCELFAHGEAPHPSDRDVAHLHGHDRVAAYTHLAAHTDQHNAALALLDQVHAEARAAGRPWTQVHAFMRGQVWLTEAGNLNDHDSVAAADAWGRAYRQAWELNLYSMLNACLNALRTLAVNAVNRDASHAVLGAMFGFTPAFEARYGDRLRKVLHGIGLATAPLRGPFDEVAVRALIMHRQMFKAPLLDALVAHPGPIVLDETATALLAVAEGAEKNAAKESADVPAPDEDPVYEELQLLSHVHSDEQLPGRTAAETLVNARRRLDGYLTNLSASNDTRRFAIFPPYAEPRPFDNIPDRLGDTVLVDFWLGNDEQRRLACYTTVLAAGAQLISHIGVAVLSAGQEGDVLQVTDREAPGYRLMAYPAAPVFAQLRVELQMQPDIRPVSRSAQQLLEQLAGMLLGGGVADVLRELYSQGFRHLCLWPHSPLWNVPLQLLMPTKGRPLADDWIVTSLPTPSMLSGLQQMIGSGLVIASSPSGGESYGLPTEPDVVSQAQMIAASFPGARVLGAAQSTPDRIMAEASNARYLHLAAHGEDYPAAPAFACLYFTSEHGSEGRLFAHRVVRHDLRGIDVVTLSACESALGRSDVSDNLRGLTSAFLQAGAGAVVAALWPVSVSASSAFFTAFYTALAAGGSPLDSFRAAQNTTRRQYPGFKDWGAFTFIGGWRRGHEA